LHTPPQVVVADASTALEESRVRLDAAIVALGTNPELQKLRENLEAAGRKTEDANAVLASAKEQAAKFGYKVDDSWPGRHARPQTPLQRAGLLVFTSAAELDVQAAAEATSVAHVALRDAINEALTDDIARHEAAQIAYNEARVAEAGTPIKITELRETGGPQRSRVRPGLRR
jgi:hypothetical protein